MPNNSNKAHNSRLGVLDNVFIFVADVDVMRKQSQQYYCVCYAS